tara:strand:+ start:1026 stop:1661 length:636 start_codon:yes stop_codon:yes gene_type:complete
MINFKFIKKIKKENDYIYNSEPYYILAYFLKKYNIPKIRLSKVVDLFLLIETINLIQKKPYYFKNFKIKTIMVKNDEIEDYFLYKNYLVFNKESDLMLRRNLLDIKKEKSNYCNESYYILTLKDNKKYNTDIFNIEKEKVPEYIDKTLQYYVKNYIKNNSYGFNNILDGVSFLPFIKELTGFHYTEVDLEKEVIKYLREKYKYTGQKNIKF